MAVVDVERSDLRQKHGLQLLFSRYKEGLKSLNFPQMLHAHRYLAYLGFESHCWRSKAVLHLEIPPWHLGLPLVCNQYHRARPRPKSEQRVPLTKGEITSALHLSFSVYYQYYKTQIFQSQKGSPSFA